MPNKVADHRRRVVYIEEKDNWNLMSKFAKKDGTKPSIIIREATRQMCKMLRENPNTRFTAPIFDEPINKGANKKVKEAKFRVFCPKCRADHRVPLSSIGSPKSCRDCGGRFVIRR
jgi:hypothetical protein